MISYKKGWPALISYKKDRLARRARASIAGGRPAQAGQPRPPGGGQTRTAATLASRSRRLGPGPAQPKSPRPLTTQSSCKEQNRMATPVQEAKQSCSSHR